MEQPQPVDGFTLDPLVRPLPQTYPALSLSAIDLLRQASNYRPRWYVVPVRAGDPPVVLAARQTYECQLQIVAGSWWWGWQADVPLLGALNRPFGFNVTEESTGRRFASDLARVNAAGAFGLPFTGWGLKHPINFLAEPWLVLEPGLLNVELYSVLTIDITPQFILMFAEPSCAGVREVQPCGQ